MQKKDLLPLTALAANLFILIFSFLPILFSINEAYLLSASVTVFAFLVSLNFISFYSQFHRRFVSTIYLLLSAIVFFLLSVFISGLILFGLLNTFGFFLNLRKMSGLEIKKKHLIFLLIFLLLVPSFFPYPYKTNANKPVQLQFFAKPDDIPDNVQVLNELKISLSISPSNLNENTIEVVKRLNKNEIDVYATLILEKENGIYANDKNSGLFLNHYFSFRDWSKNYDLKFEGVMIDSEPEFQFFHRLALAKKDMDLLKIPRILKSQKNDSRHEQAIENYSRLIEEIKDDEYQATLIAMPQVADDFLDGDDSLQRFMGVASLPPTGWDEKIFMIYRSTYEETLLSDPGPYLIYSYGKTILNNLNNGSIAIGVAGYFDEPEVGLSHRSYLTVDKLSRDVKILNSLGFSKIHIFSLGTFLDTFGEENLKNRLKTSGKANFNYNWQVAFSRISPMIFDRLAKLSY